MPVGGDSGKHLLAGDVFTMPLSTPSHPGMWIESGWPTARTHTLSHDDGVHTFVWEITDGAVADVENDEHLLVLTGSGRLTFEDGQEVPLAPGALVRLRAGDRTQWTVRRTMRALMIAVTQQVASRKDEV